MMRRPIVIVGAGGFAREVLVLIRDVNQREETWEVVGFLDDDERLWGEEVCGLQVIGGQSWLEAQATPIAVAIGIGNPRTRMILAESMKQHGCEFPTLIHPSVVASEYVSLGLGTIVTAGNILTTQVTIGDFVLLNLACTVGHDVVIGDYATLSPGINVSGNVRIGAGSDIGTGAALIPGVHVGEWSTVGAGAVVTKDLPPNCVAVGVPARVIKQREPGWQLVRE